MHLRLGKRSSSRNMNLSLFLTPVAHLSLQNLSNSRVSTEELTFAATQLCIVCQVHVCAKGKINREKRDARRIKDQ